MKILSLFDGISCGQVALERAGIPVEVYYASEIDKYAIEITQKNYPNTIQLGDVNKWQEWNIDFSSIDLLIGGSPCQGFSVAGKQLNFNDERSKLFFVFVDILNHIKKVNPNIKFLLENVKMKKEYSDAISEILNCKPIEINSALVSAQNRKRLYWTNIPNVTQPEDKHIYLDDIVKPDALIDRDKSHAILASIGNTTHREYFKKAQGQLVYIAIMLSNIYGGFQEKKPRVKIDKSFCIRTARGGGHIPSLIIEGKTKQISLENFKQCIRKVTPLECERLQTLPDNYTEGISNTQRYKTLGNGWTVDVIAHIFSFLRKEFWNE